MQNDRKVEQEGLQVSSTFPRSKALDLSVLESSFSSTTTETCTSNLLYRYHLQSILMDTSFTTDLQTYTQEDPK